MLSPVAFLQRPLRWLQAISETGATISGGPDFAYDLCVRKIAPGDREQLNLSHWQVAFNGAEPIRAETLDRFAEAFAPCGFRREAFLPCYGLAESTLLVSGLRARKTPFVLDLRASSLGEDRVELVRPSEDSRAVVASGLVPGGNDVDIVHSESGELCSPDQIGEIWVRGPGVAEGYWDQPGATAATFGALLSSGVGPFLKTGDMGFVRDGELFVTGRLKDMMIVRGRNVYPQDIEWTAERCHASLRPGGGGAFTPAHSSMTV